MTYLKSIFREKTNYQYYLLSVIIFGLSYGLYKGVFDNYLAQIAFMNEFDKGVNEFFRELPGVCIIFILAILYKFSAQKIYKLGAIIMFIGMMLQAVIPPSHLLITMVVCLYSLGEHLQQATKNTITLTFSKEGASGRALGVLNATNQIGNLIGYGLIIVVFLFLESSIGLFKIIFALSAAMILIAFLFSTKIKEESLMDNKNKKFYFHPKFKKYYILELFYGARKQVFFTFGPYVLVLFYHASPSVISILFAVSSICCFLASPIVGKMIDKLGYKVIMIADTLILVVVCFFYGFSHHIFSMETAFIVCCVNYVLDSIISLASMAANVYVQDLSDNQEELKSTISTGLSVNHLITIVIALCGGWIWQNVGIESLFIISAILGLCNSAYAATIKTNK